MFLLCGECVRFFGKWRACVCCRKGVGVGGWVFLFWVVVVWENVVSRCCRRRRFPPGLIGGCFCFVVSVGGRVFWKMAGVCVLLRKGVGVNRCLFLWGGERGKGVVVVAWVLPAEEISARPDWCFFGGEGKGVCVVVSVYIHECFFWVMCVCT